MKNPFKYATKGDLKLYRALAEGIRDWKQQAVAGNYQRWDLPETADAGHYGFTRMYLLLDEFEHRAVQQLKKTKQWPQIEEARYRDYLWRTNRAAYETYMLRVELAERNA